MRFDNIEQLVSYLTECDMQLSDLEINIPKESSLNGGECQCNHNTDEIVTEEKTTEVKLLSLSNDPVIEGSVGEQNKLMVQAFDAIPGMCAMGKIQFGDRTLTMGVCESEGKSTIRLDVEVNGELRKDVPFELEVSKNCGIIVTP